MKTKKNSKIEKDDLGINEENNYDLINTFFSNEKYLKYNLNFLLSDDLFSDLDKSEKKLFEDKILKKLKYSHFKNRIKSIKKRNKYFNLDFSLNLYDFFEKKKKVKNNFIFLENDVSKNNKINLINNFIEEYFQKSNVGEINIMNMSFTNLLDLNFSNSKYNFNKYKYDFDFEKYFEKKEIVKENSMEISLRKTVNFYKPFGDIEQKNSELIINKIIDNNSLNFSSIEQIRIFKEKIIKQNSTLIIFDYNFENKFINNMILSLKNENGIKALIFYRYENIDNFDFFKKLSNNNLTYMFFEFDLENTNFLKNIISIIKNGINENTLNLFKKVEKEIINEPIKTNKKNKEDKTKEKNKKNKEDKTKEKNKKNKEDKKDSKIIKNNDKNLSKIINEEIDN